LEKYIYIYIYTKRTKYFYVDHIKEDEIGGACGTHERYEEHIQNFGRDNLDCIGLDEWMLLLDLCGS
jgi:hypothetical protein